MSKNFNAFDLLVPPERSGNYDSYVIERNLWYLAVHFGQVN